MPKKSILYVLVKAKDLTKYVIDATEKSPKKFRFTLVTRIQNYCLDVIEFLIIANQVKENDMRMKYQDKAQVSLRLLDSLCDISLSQGCITFTQYENISKGIAETLDYLSKWKMSTKRVLIADGNLI